MTESQGRAKLQKRALERRKQLGMAVGRPPSRDQGTSEQAPIRAALDALMRERDELRAHIAEHEGELKQLNGAIAPLRRLLGEPDERLTRAGKAQRIPGKSLLDRCIDYLEREDEPRTRHQIAEAVGSAPGSGQSTVYRAR